MRAALSHFLQERDLNKLPTLFEALSPFHEDDEITFYHLFNEWKDEQGISNALMYPEAIPQDVRKAFVTKGFLEKKQLYLVLSAVVGLQNPTTHMLFLNERDLMKEELFRLIEAYKSSNLQAIAQQASIALQHFVDESDIDTLKALANQNDEVLRHNALALIKRTLNHIDLEIYALANPEIDEISDFNYAYLPSFYEQNVMEA